jgi:hypothetical protein
VDCGFEIGDMAVLAFAVKAGAQLFLGHRRLAEPMPMMPLKHS